MAKLSVEIFAAPRSGEIAHRLKALDSEGRLAVSVVADPGSAAMVVAPTWSAPEDSVDAVIDGTVALGDEVASLWHDRLEPFARIVTGVDPIPSGRSELHDHDPAYSRTAERLLGRIRSQAQWLAYDDGSWTYDHIGSTAVPGLRAKPIVDLQVGVDSLPDEGGAVDEAFANLGFVPTTGARPDSPGVYRDQVKDPQLAADAAYDKRLYVRPDPVHPAVLHVRRVGSPWWRYVTDLRDWLQSDAEGRQAYEDAKQRAVEAHAGDPDYDDYTRAKAAFFDEVRANYEK